MQADMREGITSIVSVLTRTNVIAEREFDINFGFLALIIDVKVIKAPEEIQEAAVIALSAVIMQHPHVLLRRSDDDTFLPVLGHCVSALLGCAVTPRGGSVNDKPRSLKYHSHDIHVISPNSITEWRVSTY